MKDRLPIALSVTALIVSVLGFTPVGEAAKRLVVPRNSVGSGQLKAVHARHLHVDDCHLERIALSHCVAQAIECLHSVGHAVAAHAAGHGVVREDLRVCGVVVDYQDPSSGKLPRVCHGRQTCCRD